MPKNRKLSRSEQTGITLVVGAGGIGGITAGILAASGIEVHLLCKYPQLAEKIRTTGLHIFGMKGDFRVSLPAYAAPEQLTEKYDIVLLATKAPDIPDVARRILPHITSESVVVSMPNGFCEDDLAAIVGKERTIGCTVGWGATMHAPGELEMTAGGLFIIGTLDNAGQEKLGLLKEMLSRVGPTEVSLNIYGHVYSKLIINSCTATLGGLCGLTLGQMLSIKKLRVIFIEIIREALKVSEALGIRVEPYANRLNYYSFLEGKGKLSDLRRHLFIRLIGAKYRREKSTFLQSLERGKKTEVDYLNGFICQKAIEHGIDTPLHEKLTRMVHEVEEKKRPISLSNFADPFFNNFK